MEYEEIETEYEEEVTGGDIAFILGGVLCGCIVIAFIMHLIKKTFKNVHLKIGNKIELGLENKEEKTEIQNSK